ncbi:hypothetical protein CMQ_1199 [Grosmannia clavigera kw1407]|uniref:Uncharacterized protein n=1 Tax=Grosmannia clavigera (strain kw1407 / UAMH 11150) TaxID=655863 RepID=F0XCV4_GROCL|nr:uncharacterized protein CMQ_1199 [Grosmannia clavigera kw1407]EFX04271.1 hypothetical protein CMQ_1199 [Grosmannia clavigera kw1407]
MDAMGKRALLEADLASMAVHPGKLAFVREGDIICVWWARLATKHLLPPNSDTTTASSNQTVTLNSAMSLREPLPLGGTTAAIRCALIAQCTRPQIEAYSSLWRAAPGKILPLVGDSGMHMLTFSNWCRANLSETDLSAAVVSSNTSSGRSGRPSYFQNDQFGLIMPDGFPIIG